MAAPPTTLATLVAIMADMLKFTMTAKCAIVVVGIEIVNVRETATVNVNVTANVVMIVTVTTDATVTDVTPEGIGTAMRIGITEEEEEVGKKAISAISEEGTSLQRTHIDVEGAEVEVEEVAVAVAASSIPFACILTSRPDASRVTAVPSCIRNELEWRCATVLDITITPPLSS